MQCGGETKLTKLKPLIMATYPSNSIGGYDKSKQSGGYFTSVDDNEDHQTGDDHDYDPWYYDQDLDEYDSTLPDDYWYNDDDCQDFEDPEAIQDDDGYMLITQETNDKIETDICTDDPEYATALLNFTEARDVLKKLQVARQFFPVVVPASTLKEVNSGRRAIRRVKGKGKGKGKGKSNKGKGKPKGKSTFSKGRGKYGRGKTSSRRPTSFPSTLGGKPSGEKSADDPICFKCGQPGHFARNCPTVEASNKRQRIEHWDAWYQPGDGDYETAYVSLELEPLPDDFDVYCSTCSTVDQTRMSVLKCCNVDHMETKKEDVQRAEDDHFQIAAAFLDEDLYGCAIVDSGASSGVVSVQNFDQMQGTYLDAGDRLCDHAKVVNRHFSVANGEQGVVKFQTTIQPIAESPFQGRSYTVCVDANKPETNRTPFLVGSDYLKKHRCIVDFDSGVMVYKDDPETIHHLKVGRNGHTLLMPITREQCERHYYRTKLDQSHCDVFKSTVTRFARPVNRESRE